MVYYSPWFSSLTIEDKTKVGKKGKANPGELIIRKVYSIEELLEMPIISSGTAKSVKEDIRKEAQIQERLTNEKY